MGGLAVNGALEIIDCPRRISEHTKRYVMLRICGLLLGFVGN